MKKTRIVSLCASLLFASNSYADFVGLNIGSSYWSPELSGTLNSNNNAGNINVDSDISSQPSFEISFEHPIPLLPNIKLQNRELSSTGSDANVNSITFKGKSFTGNISSTLDLSHRDIVLYYELLDNWINLDLGINLKTFNGEVTISEDATNKNRSLSIDKTIPLLYLSARFDLPFSGFYVGADLQNISLDDNGAEDSTLMVGYETSSGFGIEGGYKKFSLNLENAGSLNTDIKYNGLYLNGYIHF